MVRDGGYGKPLTLLLLAHLIFASIPAMATGAELPAFAVARTGVPLFNSPDFQTLFGGKDGSTLKLDQCGQMRELEFVALPGTPFRIEGAIKGSSATIYRVSTPDYPYPSKSGYFIDSRLVTTNDKEPPPRQRHLPELNKIVERLITAVGTPYVWGGNIRNGIPELLSIYPPSGKRFNLKRWELAGVDCSGLLYEATNGWTPRNTSSLVSFGSPVPIKGLSGNAMARKLAPLDLIVWPGHVMIVIDRERVIESRLDCKTGQGVVIRPLANALTELLRNRVPLNDYAELPANRKGFVVRRWYDERLVNREQ